jgi:two-component system CitB family sensor kinase
VPVLMGLRRLSLARQLLALQVLIVVGVVAVGGALTYLDQRRTATEQARDKVLSLAATVAHIPVVAEAVAAGDPERRLQPLAESVRVASAVDFVVIMTPSRIRYTHPNPAVIGKEFIGTTEPALRGESFTETYTGTLGPSVRAVVPVVDAGGHVIGLVSVGIVTSSIGERVAGKVPTLLAVCLLAVGAAGLASLLVSRWVRRSTLGLGPQQITRMYEHHDAVLHAVREGLVVVDADRRLVLANDEAVRLLRLDEDHEGRPVAALPLPDGVCDLLASGRSAQDELVIAGDHVVVVSQSPTRRDGQYLGTVTTLRDHTELLGLTQELDSVRGFAEALRAQAHEAANRLHTVVTMVELGRPQEAVQFAVAELRTSQELADRLLDAVEEPALAALLLGKVAQAHERGVELVVSPQTRLRETDVLPGDLVSVVGNLLDNAVDAALAAPPPHTVHVSVVDDDAGLVVRVEDSGPGLGGVSPGEVFRRGWTTKRGGTHPRGLGLALVEQVVRSYGGTIEVDGGGSGRGAVFTVALPRRTAGAARS